MKTIARDNTLNPFGLKAAKQISAFVRVYNEEEFLKASVKSIIDGVEEVVIIDSNSTDGTPEIIEELKELYPYKVKSYNYDYEITKMGADHFRTFMEDPYSPTLLSNFYNWCLSKCSYEYALKWDADMIGTDMLLEELDYWKNVAINTHLLVISGYNIHPDRDCLVKQVTRGRVLTMGGVPFPAANYLSPFTSPEKRGFPHLAYIYIPRYWYCEGLFTPFEGTFGEHVVNTPCFLHMKYCKKSMKHNFDNDIRELYDQIDKGIQLNKTIEQTLYKYRDDINW